MKKTKLLGLTGKMFSGKTTVADYLATKTSTHILKLAAPIYEIKDLVYQRIYKEPPVKDRKLMQYIGGTWGRSIDPNLWVNIWELDYKQFRFFKDSEHQVLVIVDDVRYDNEADKIRSLGGRIVRIEATTEDRATRGTIEGQEHDSEKGVDINLVDLTIFNSGDLNALKKNVDYVYDTLFINTGISFATKN